MHVQTALNEDEEDPSWARKKTSQPKSLVEKKKEEEHAKQFRLKFKEALARKIRMIAENEILMKSYLEEKRKLEHQILKDNKKNEAT